MVGWLLYVVVGFVMLYQHVVKYHAISKWLAVSCCMQMYIETSCHIYKWLFSSFEMIWNHVGNGNVFRVLSGHFSDENFQLFSTLGWLSPRRPGKQGPQQGSL